jgi:hypothetical protein
MANTYTLIEAKTLGSAVSSVTFNSIPQTYTDILLKVSARGTTSSNAIDTKLTFNGSTAGYTLRNVYGDGSSVGSFSDSTTNYTGGEINGASSTGSTFSNNEFYVPNYTSANYKSFSADIVTENNGTAAIAWMHAGLWSNTAAITSLTIASASGNLDTYSTFYLYGISNS